MSKRATKQPTHEDGVIIPATGQAYGRLVSEISDLLEQSRRMAARSVNAVLTATYWDIGRRIVEHEQGGKSRAEYGEELLQSLAIDLTAKYGRGFSRQGLQRMRSFYLGWEICSTPSGKLEAAAICSTVSSKSVGEICQTPSGQFPIAQTPSAKLNPTAVPGVFPISWSHYTRLMSIAKPHARVFYETEAIRGGWSVRQLDRQISTQFFERTAHSKKQAVMLARGQQARPEDVVTLEDEVRDPYVLEFLNLKDEYSESELEEALVRHLETFLWNWGQALPLWLARNAFASAMSGIALTCFCFTAGCGAWWPST